MTSNIGFVKYHNFYPLHRVCIFETFSEFVKNFISPFADPRIIRTCSDFGSFHNSIVLVLSVTMVSNGFNFLPDVGYISAYSILLESVLSHVIWFVDEKDWLGRQVKKKVYKKIKKNGKTTEILDPNFFGGGMYTLHKPPEKLSYKMEYAEIYPTSGKKLKPFDTIVTDRTRTIELWKEPKSEQVRIILGSAKGDMKFFTNSLNVSNIQTR